MLLVEFCRYGFVALETCLRKLSSSSWKSAVVIVCGVHEYNTGNASHLLIDSFIRLFNRLALSSR